MLVVDLEGLQSLIQHVGLTSFFDKVIARLAHDYQRWDVFQKGSRHAHHSPHGVIELMPISDDTYYAVKYVNGHPVNTQHGKPCVMALGLLATVADGAPIMLSEMTLLTAIRTACTSALVARYASIENASTLGFIGLGAQAEFQALALSRVRPIKRVVGFDIDTAAIQKTAHNLAQIGITLERASSAQAVAQTADILTTATAAKAIAQVFSYEDLKPGCHINAIGGDCPGKTELNIADFSHSPVIVEYLPQTQIEGEIQHALTYDNVLELHDIVSGKVTARTNETHMTLFDSVGFALEDYAILRVVHELVSEKTANRLDSMVPELDNPKDLFSLIT